MKHKLAWSLLIPLAFGLASILNSQAQWLTHTPDNAQPPGIATNAMFPSGLSGTVTTSVSILTTVSGMAFPEFRPTRLRTSRIRS